MNAPARALLALLWALLLLGMALLVGSRLQVSGDLRLFMPAPQTADQRLLLGSLGEGPGARLWLVALTGAAPEVLADHSLALRDGLRERPEFSRVMNGEQGLEDFDETLLPYRYLLSPTFDDATLDGDYLRTQLRARVQDLGSPAAALVEPWLARDPTLELLRLAELWQPPQEPERAFGVWFGRDRNEALLLLETTAAGFDPLGQQQALKVLNDVFADSAEDVQVKLEVSGPGAFSVLMRERTQHEATRLGIVAGAVLLMLLTLAYRSLRLPLLGALPLATAALAGMAAVAALFGSVHGITLAFGVTLIGVALDYPVHLFSHHRPQLAAWTTVRDIWPTLAAGAVSTCLAYLSFLASGVEGLTQLAVFALVGLLAAALCTRFMLPALLPAAQRDLAQARLPLRLDDMLQAWRLPLFVPILLAALASVWLLLSPRPLWDDNLANLTPVPKELLDRDRELRAALGATDVRHVLVLEAADGETLLQRCEALLPALDALVDAGAVAAFEPPCRYLPSQRTQRTRQARLPDTATLAASLHAASDGLPFREGAFDPFLRDVENARAATPLSLADIEHSALASRLAALLPQGTQAPTALIGLAEVGDAAALRGFAASQGEDLHLLDMKSASEALAAAYRERVLLALLLMLAIMAAALLAFLRRPRRVLRVLLPVLLSALLVAGLLHALGVAFNLFHVVALILASGLGLDYALFFERAGAEPAERRRTLHGIVVCALSTALVFGLLASSTIPVLRAIGLTVAVGVAVNFLLAALIARSAPDAART
jgi:predicted exporter